MYSFISKSKTNLVFTLAVVFLGLAAAGGILYYVNLFTSQQIEAIIMPHQETPYDDISSWETYINQEYGFEFKYPSSFGANVWKTFFWPPVATVVSISSDPIQNGCPQFALGASNTEQAVTLNNINFTLYTSTDGGAGTFYKNYCYVTSKGQDYFVLNFVISYHIGCYQGGCGAYCGTPYEVECRNFDLARDVDQPIQTMVSTFKFINQ